MLPYPGPPAYDSGYGPPGHDPATMFGQGHGHGAHPPHLQPPGYDMGPGGDPYDDEESPEDPYEMFEQQQDPHTHMPMGMAMGGSGFDPKEFDHGMGAPPYGMPQSMGMPQGMASQAMPHGIVPTLSPPQDMLPHGMPHGMVPPHALPHGMPPHGMPPHGMPHAMAPGGMDSFVPSQAMGGPMTLGYPPDMPNHMHDHKPAPSKSSRSKRRKRNSYYHVNGREYQNRWQRLTGRFF